MSGFKTILWDIDGTLIDFKKSEYVALRACFENFGVLLTDEQISKYHIINRSYWDAFDKGEIQKSVVYTARFADFCKILNFCGTTPEEINSLYQILLGECSVMFDGAYELCCELKDKGFLQYAVTNGSTKAQEIKLEKTGLINLFDGVFISDKIGHAKPESKFFEYVFSNIPHFCKDSAIIIGDNLVCDIDGGSKAGLTTCYFDYESKGYAEIIPDFIVNNMYELKRLLLS